MKRSSGILMSITSLPNAYGIGTFGKEAYEFVDFLNKSGQSYWQVLPLNPTSFGDSPYQSPSAFAGNPYFIDFELLERDNLLKKSDYEFIDFGCDEERIDYEKIFKNKMKVLRIAFTNKDEIEDEDIKKFRKENQYWVEDYALYMALKYKFDLKSWQDWDKDIKIREKEKVNYYKKKLKEEIDYWIFIQFLFFKQWNNLKDYANRKRIKIIGDVPIYVAEDSADTWANSEIFLLDDNRVPIVVSGVPPDGFSSDGQLWGNPIYNWDLLEERNFDWWIERLTMNLNLYDVIRIDHFRGFESYWQVKYGERTAVNGEWVKGPNIRFFKTVYNCLGNIPIIVEDLGYLTKEVLELRDKLGYPGMKILQFAFDSDENNDYLPHNYDRNCVAYTGTHDNNTVIGWLDNTDRRVLEFCSKYLGLNQEEGYNWGMIRGTWASIANLSIAQLQDFLSIDSKGRMNIPSKVDGNWQWRLKKEQLTSDLAEKIYSLTKMYRRIRD
ncbi:4-alpha-glucanotransferase MalQ [Gottschalkia acidurici 9a]|uniref:4-alpha-glucanotransferase n=1 Tax=Gottschalkia acidurici (strain ATCC 7906 / DSM 604 / BCRC 14475 / CIP 104303 / KCTC 5404 / NCIMB 10678 / 9a) TaxID=1128398 RepID=K0AVY0_GOTA9|nr:4-alpha-glucanotransferase [Gottschalkia acidurici]AFS78038.1 4-alpha-glucanotransferase MalQ [Gottschalkia acidurici 9a]